MSVTKPTQKRDLNKTLLIGLVGVAGIYLTHSFIKRQKDKTRGEQQNLNQLGSISGLIRPHDAAVPGETGTNLSLEKPGIPQSHVGFDESVPVMMSSQLTRVNPDMIPFRYNYPGSDVQDLYDNTQTIPYINERMDALNGIFPELLDETMYGQYDGFLGIGENDSINGLIPPIVVDWAMHEPTPEGFLKVGEMDNFWSNQLELTGGEFQLEPDMNFVGFCNQQQQFE